METKIRIFNTIHGKKEVFHPLTPQKILLYVCGITPYDYAHIGHARVYITFDLLNRLLQNTGYEVIYTRNFTDIDDKILNRAKHELGDSQRYKEITDTFISAFHQDLERLNCLPPTFEPKVTDHIPQIITFIEQLIQNGCAYISNKNVYFSIDTFKNYGKLSKRDMAEHRAGVRVDIREDKKNPADFALWKYASQEEVGWNSPWGKGRPGWHIECSVLAYLYLGKEIDIHGGGMDLIFPHHENEIAQSECAFNLPLARYWMHNAFVQLNKEKMSKSLGNIVNLHTIFNTFHPDVLRYYMLTHHYRAPIDFSFEDVQSAEKGYKRLINLFENDNIESIGYENQPIAREMLDYLCDDLNTPGMLGVVFENIKKLQENTIERAGVYYVLYTVLGLRLEQLPSQKIEITSEIEQLIQAREQARKEKNWSRADEIRDQLKSMGIEIQDKKT